MTYTTEQLDTIAAKLRSMPACDKPKPAFSTQAAAAVLARQIGALRNRADTLVQSAEALRRAGLEIATPTLNSYLPRTKPPSESANRSPAKKTANTPPTTGRQPARNWRAVRMRGARRL